MSAAISFNIKVLLENGNMLPELQGRMQDLSPAFQAIYGSWVKLNEQNFELAQGKEAGGADIFDVQWAALTPGYIKQKHPGGAPKRQRRKAGKGGYQEYPDWLMVRSGALMEALTNPEAMFQEFDKQMAAFGTPTDPDLADIVIWQMGTRQKERYVVFLSEPDRNMIERTIQDYFSLGGEFADIRFAQGMAALNKETEVEQLDAEFGGAE